MENRKKEVKKVLEKFAMLRRDWVGEWKRIFRKRDWF